jgi:putative chitinase
LQALSLFFLMYHGFFGGISMDINQLAAATGSTIKDAAPFLRYINSETQYFGLTSPHQLAAFLSNFGHETGGMRRMVESLNYSTDGLLLTFGRHRISAEDAQKYGRNKGHKADQEALGNILYGGDWGSKNLGNTQAGDGWMFRGRGMGITGRANYSALGPLIKQLTGVEPPDFVRNPEWVSTPPWAVVTASAWWVDRGLHKIEDFDKICDRVNMGRETSKIGDSIGYAERLKLYKVGLSVFL